MVYCLPPPPLPLFVCLFVCLFHVQCEEDWLTIFTDIITLCPPWFNNIGESAGKNGGETEDLIEKAGENGRLQELGGGTICFQLQ